MMGAIFVARFQATALKDDGIRREQRQRRCGIAAGQRSVIVSDGLGHSGRIRRIGLGRVNCGHKEQQDQLQGCEAHLMSRVDGLVV